MTRAQLQRLFSLTRGAAVLGIGLGGGATACDHSSGDAPLAPAGSGSTVTPQSSATIATADDDAGPIRPRRFPVPNAMPRRMIGVDAGVLDAAMAAPPIPQPPPPG